MTVSADEMRRPVVVGSDGSSAALRAVEWGAEWSATRGAPLQVLSAVGVSSEVYARGTPPPQSFFDDLTGEARRVAREAVAAARHAQPGLEVGLSIPNAAPVVSLLEASATARLVVVGSRGWGGTVDMLAGSTAVALATHARCPVAVVRGPEPGKPPPRMGPVVVGIDGSAVNEDAVRLGFEEASRRRSGLVAVHSFLDLSSGPQRYRPLDHDVVEHGARAVLSGQLAVYEDKYPEVSVQRVITADRPVKHLIERSVRAQLLVVGSRGRGGFGGLLLGSTSQALVYHARCPVLVARACSDGGGTLRT